jgi:histidinol-phosphate/aromatic aminotransferase/cobyric acid decarboxylase-like protein
MSFDVRDKGTYRCGSKAMPDADRCLRIASRTAAENRRLVDGLSQLGQDWS